MEDETEMSAAERQRIDQTPVYLPPARPQRRRVVLPVVLFVATCLSTFYAAATFWMPALYLGHWSLIKTIVVENWSYGLSYMLAIMAILITHEMGHFWVTLRYRIPASYPMFIPVPFTPFGTMGAVIGINGMKANRREMFDLGLSGPVAGLLVAVPIFWYGIAQIDFDQPTGFLAFHNPLIGRWLMARLHPGVPVDAVIGIGQVNPYFMAGWVGMLVTGLNMLPISQLDGGHVIYALFRRRAHTIARIFLISAIAYIVLQSAYMWTVMLLLIILMGTDHPPTSDDRAPLGPVRWLLGIASLAIPILCFTPQGIESF